jgi:hypothetical protein
VRPEKEFLLALEQIPRVADVVRTQSHDPSGACEQHGSARKPATPW